ncbi:MAG: glutathione S-transferase family protein [Deltaproteobacteria bacterium]|nr:glutathione S-transferase family protein [Deltaproteobacteria bacterium]
MRLYDNAFSPFARKVRLVLDYKGLAFESIDALALAQHRGLSGVNARAEVPVLVDDDVTVVDSADIVAYLEDRYPKPAVFPASPALRAKARRWQRVADTVFDSIVHDISLWMWPTHQRPDRPPPGLIEAGQRDLTLLLEELENALDLEPFVCGDLSVADFALFPHVSAMKTLGLAPDERSFPRIAAWNRAMRQQPVIRENLAHIKSTAIEKFSGGPSPYEGTKVVWRGDRLEWLLCNGFHEWWLAELAAGRVIVPSSLPARGQAAH